MNHIYLFSLRVFWGFTLLMLIGLDISAQAQDLVWAKRAGGTDSEIGHAIAVDASGNGYVTGTLRGSATFGLGEVNQTIVTSAGFDDMFVAKYNSAGELLWTKRAGSTGLDEGYGIGVDASGNSYITGRFTGSATFGPDEANQTILTSAGSFDIYLAKYNSSGDLLWVKQAGGTNSDIGFGMAVDVSGNSYVTGLFTDAATFGLGEANQTILASAGYDIFVAKYNSSGNLLWARKAGGTDSDAAYGIAIDASGNSYVTGLFTGSATFGPGETNQTILTGTGASSDIFVAKFNDSGNLLWAKPAGGTSFDRGWGIAVDASGNIYVTGLFAGSATFGLGEANQAILTSAGSDESFVVKYNSSGDLLWAKQAGGTDSDISFDITVDASGNSHVTGRFTGSATFGQGEANETILTSTGSYEIFVARYNSSGNLLWARQAGGAASDIGYGIAVDASGNSYVTGYFSGSATFGQGEANQTLLTSSGFFDFFVAKFKRVQTPQEATGSLIEEVKALVNAGVLNQGQGNALIAKLEAAIKQIDNGNHNTASNQLQAFINQVNTFINSGVLTSAQGQPLIDAANAIIVALSTTAKAVQLNSGSSDLISKTEGVLPTGYRLEQNSPNPFNPVTTIQFSVPRESYVRLKVYNAFGAEVTTLVDQQVAAGTYKVNWDASRLASGFYLYRLEAEGFAQTKKLLLMK